MNDVRFSVVIPTYQRKALVVETINALARQEYAKGFEVIVVVDGSTDGTAAVLKRLTTPFSLTVLEQGNRGAATARNRGAAAARGEILLFLDDDMEGAPSLLAEHDRSHREGADVVLGHIPLHPASPPSVLSAAVGDWAERRARKLATPGVTLTFYDLLTGQLSLRAETFRRLGGFDARFTRDGSYGDEDVDFGERLLQAGLRIVFNPRAVSWQRYVVTAGQHLRQWRQTGRADVGFARKHPDRVLAIFALRRAGTPIYRRLWRFVGDVPGLGAGLSAAIRWPVVAAVDSGARVRGLFRLFRFVRDLEYWRGVRDAGGIPRPRPVRVLSYHAIADLSGDPVLEAYGVPPEVLRQQLDGLLRADYRFIAPDEFLRLLDGGGLPRRALLLTFDDCYEDLLDVATSILAPRGIAAIAFAVSGRLGATNDWDVRRGARTLKLLDVDGLRVLVSRGVEIGAHSRSHGRLTRMPTADMGEETAGAVADLERLGLNRPRFFAYPYGEHDATVRAAVAAAGVQAAFTMDPGPARAGQDRFKLPRIEIVRGDTGWRFRWKVWRAGRWRR